MTALAGPRRAPSTGRAARCAAACGAGGRGRGVARPSGATAVTGTSEPVGQPRSGAGASSSWSTARPSRAGPTTMRPPPTPTVAAQRRRGRPPPPRRPPAAGPGRRGAERAGGTSRVRSQPHLRQHAAPRATAVATASSTASSRPRVGAPARATGTRRGKPGSPSRPISTSPPGGVAARRHRPHGLVGGEPAHGDPRDRDARGHAVVVRRRHAHGHERRAADQHHEGGDQRDERLRAAWAREGHDPRVLQRRRRPRRGAV